ncbi:hypothetical protein FA15DRAFT_664554 [Coprinopsis marcescibilis]|uniref:Uncharacterized protein n=1 Tax=Coprinopsis marcescibilis TaxID=230819 RepID=A0A5C3L7Y8_COPMA|nr:hypothetical protein FA15DRAFT_664554 [Coprinopsis marcescibilis]
MDRLKLQLRQLSRQRNRLARVTRRLPPEIIRKIFLECSVQNDRACFRKQMEWTKITHVCSEWRALAIDHAELWSRIPLRAVFWAQKMVERTKQAPISIDITSGYVTPSRYSEMQAIASNLLEQTSRLRKVNLTVPTDQIRHLLESINSTAPILESLTLRATPSYSFQANWGLDNQDFGPVTIPASFLSDGAPRLHTLLLRSCTLPTTIASIASNLTALDAEYHHPSPHLIDAIGKLHHLRSLKLKLGASQLAESATLGDGPPAFLPRLDKLQLHGSFFQCIGTLSCFRIPSTASLNLNCSYPSSISNFDAFEAAVLHLQAALDISWLSSPLSTQNSVFHKISSNTYGLCQVKGWLEESSSSHQPGDTPQYDDSNPSLTINIAVNHGFDLPLDGTIAPMDSFWWLKVLPPAATSGLRQLEIELEGHIKFSDLDMDSLYRISAQFPLLEHIMFGISCGHFVDAIVSDAALVRSHGVGPPTLFPRLKTVVFNSSTCLQTVQGTGQVVSMHSVLMDLADSISIRNEYGGVTQSLELVVYGVSVRFSADGRVQRLKKLNRQCAYPTWGPSISDLGPAYPISCSGGAECRCYFGGLYRNGWPIEPPLSLP